LAAVGAVLTVPLTAQTPSAADKAVADAAAARKQLLGSIGLTQAGAFEAKPNSAGDYVYEATSAKPLVDGTTFKIEENWMVKGLTIAGVTQGNWPLCLVNNDGMYWKLSDIAPGKYFVGLVYRSDRPVTTGTIEGPAPINMLYLNGRIVQCSTLGNPVQIAPDVWFAELQAAWAESLKPGDEIAVLPQLNSAVTAARLVLHSKEPARGAHRAYTDFGGAYGMPPTDLRINAQCVFMGANGKFAPQDDPFNGHEQQYKSPDDFLRNDKGQAVAYCLVANPLPVPITVDYECIVRGHYLQVAGRDAEKLTLQPHQRIVRKVAFDLTPDVPAYSMYSELKAINPPDLGWPEADTISYFPGLRQSVPWPNPFRNSFHQRVYFTDPVKGQRQTRLLTGQWELAYSTDLNPAFPAPAEAKWQPMGVPFGLQQTPLDKMSPRPHGAYVRRILEVSPETAGSSCRLNIREVASAAEVFVNGKKVGGLLGENTPLVADVSGVLKAGKNELVIVLRDVFAIMDPAYVNPKNPTPSALYLDVPGGSGMVGLLLGEVSLETSPAVCAQDILAMPSYRHKSLGARFNVANRSDKPANLVVKAVVQDGTKEVFELGQKEMTLKIGEVAPVAFDKPWSDAHLYWPKDPFLYVLAVTVTDKDSGKTLDLARERFGFRECWIDGAKMYFNGHAVTLKGATGSNSLGADADYQLGRGAATADTMDEVGMLASEAVTAVFNSPSKHNVERDQFWDSAAANMLVAARRQQNHPCIIAWDLSNEWYCFLPYCGADMKRGAHRLEHLSEVLAKQDPTRWTWYDGDGDLQGLHNNYAGHYMTWGVQPPISGYNEDNHSVIMPDGGFYRPLDQDFKPGQKIRFNQFYQDEFFIRWNQKVVMDTENLWKVGGLMPPGFTKLMGDEDVLSPATDNSGPAAWFWKNNIEGHRDMGASSVSFYMVPGASNRGYMLQTFIMPGTIHHGFSGRRIVEKYDILNDRFDPADLTLNWSLVGPDGKSGAGGKDARHLSSAGLERGSLSFKFPNVDKRTTYVLDLRLESNGKLVYGEQRDIEVWPDAPASALPMTNRNIFLFDPKGKTAEVFKAAGIKFTRVESLDTLEMFQDPRAHMLIVVGEQALDTTNAWTFAKLNELVSHAARVLVLAQTVSPMGLPAATKIDPREWSSQTFVRMGSHPILKGVTSWDLHFWSPDRVVARGAYNKPDGGPAVALVDSGTDIGLEWVQMMELYQGKGSYILCQLPLIDRFNDEPMAREMLSRTLAYLGGPELFLAPTGKLQVITKEDSPVHNALRQGGVSFDLAKLDAAFDGKSIVLVDAAQKPTKEQAKDWYKAMHDGATFVVCGATPDDKWMDTLSWNGTRTEPMPRVYVTVPPYNMWQGRGYRVGFDKLTAGLSHCDLYYKRFDGSEPAGSQAEDPTLTIQPLQDFAVTGSGVDDLEFRELVFPGALVELKVDKGRLIVDQRRWMTSDERLARQAQRNLASLALGLGVEVAPVATPRQLPKDIALKIMDLTAFANRSLVDDVADDGKGGWSDQGPNADLRTFPTGKQTFQGVPFEIDKTKSCIALASNGRPGVNAMPREVTIPIGFKAEGFYFLHSAAYSGNVLTGMYQIQYADGTTFDIPLRGEENIRDWAATPGPLLREKGTQSVVAWTGKCQMFPSISVYRMLWVNPKPDLAVKAIRFSNPTMDPVPILMGLTAAVGKGQSTETPQTLSQMRDLLAQAGKLVADKKDNEALPILKKAVALDPTMTAAQQALVDLYERAGNEDAALAAYQAWVLAGAATPLPYNRIGEILEKRKDFKGALEAYTKSLKVEWNQPPIIEAKKRLETKQQ
jgi:hypothetical protein